TFIAGVRREVLARIAELGQRHSGQPVRPLPDQVAGTDYATLVSQGLDTVVEIGRPRVAWAGVAGFEDGRVAVLTARVRMVHLTDGAVLADRDVQYSAVVKAPTPTTSGTQYRPPGPSATPYRSAPDDGPRLRKALRDAYLRLAGTIVDEVVPPLPGRAA